MFCSKCGAQNAPGSVACVSCGTGMVAPVATSTGANSTLSVVSFILAFLFPIGGLITSIIAKIEYKKSNGAKGDIKLAKLALPLSIVFFVLQVISIIVIVIIQIKTAQAVADLSNLDYGDTDFTQLYDADGCLIGYESYDYDLGYCTPDY